MAGEKINLQRARDPCDKFMTEATAMVPTTGIIDVTHCTVSYTPIPTAGLETKPNGIVCDKKMPSF